MTLQERQAQEEREEKQAKIKSVLLTAGLLPVLLALALVIKYMPIINRAVTQPMHPQPQHRTGVAEIFDNSKSFSNHSLAADEADIINPVLAKWLNPAQCALLRFGNKPVELGVSVLDPVRIHVALEDNYRHVQPDPQDGSFATPTVQQALASMGFDPQALVIVMATDGFEDSNAFARYIAELKKSHRIILLLHAVPIHNVRRANIQEDWRGSIRKKLEPILQDDLFITSTPDELSDVLSRLPARLHANGIIN